MQKDCHTCHTPCCHQFKGCSFDTPCLCAMSNGSPTANRIWLDYAGAVEPGTFGHYLFEQVAGKCFEECKRAYKHGKE